MSAPSGQVGGSTAIDEVVARIAAVYGRWTRETSVAAMRRDWDGLFATSSHPHDFEPAMAGDVPVAWIMAPGSDRRRVIVYFHGGGFRLGSIASHRGLMARLSAASGCAVLGVDYRLAPEHRFPAPVEDARAVWDWLAEMRFDPAHIAVAGDSAGGGLAVSLMLSLRAAGRALPAAGLLLSPWTDMAATGESYATRAAHDPIHQRTMILALARGYLGATGDPQNPLASPLYADLTGLPPLAIQVGDRETVLDDARELARRARAAGVAVDLQVWDGMIHVFQMFDELPEARQAIERSARFLSGRLSRGGVIAAPAAADPGKR